MLCIQNVKNFKFTSYSCYIDFFPISSFPMMVKFTKVFVFHFLKQTAPQISIIHSSTTAINRNSLSDILSLLFIPSDFTPSTVCLVEHVMSFSIEFHSKFAFTMSSVNRHKRRIRKNFFPPSAPLQAVRLKQRQKNYSAR